MSAPDTHEHEHGHDHETPVPLTEGPDGARQSGRGFGIWKFGLHEGTAQAKIRRFVGAR